MQFNPLSLEDKEYVERITSQMPPYSDFNFFSLWTWNKGEGLLIARIDNGFVIQLKDYLDDSKAYVYMVELSSGVEVHKAILEKIPNELIKFIPEEYQKILINNGIHLREDMDNFDYIYDINQMIAFGGKHLRSKRNLYNRYNRYYPDSRVNVYEHSIKNGLFYRGVRHVYMLKNVIITKH